MKLSGIFAKTITLLRSNKRRKNCRYQSMEEMLSHSEHNFLGILNESLPRGYEIIAKVRITDVLTPSEIFELQNCSAALHRHSPKHFDYILCEKHTLTIVAVIELDDHNHIQREARARDKFIERACKTAGFKLLRFPYRSSYHVHIIREIIIHSLNSPYLVQSL